jgi:CelD/BcsL family acetyltransferase involved in cellulose biosynthesis
MTGLNYRIHESVEAAGRDWDQLEARGVHTPYQRRAWSGAYLAHVGTAEGAKPAIATIHDADGAPLALFPFCVTHAGPARILRFVGGKHANFSMGLFAPDAGRLLDAPALTGLFKAVHAATGAQTAILQNQPREWQGFANPLAVLPCHDSPEPAYKFRFTDDVASMLEAKLSPDARRKMKRKERRLAELGTIIIKRAETPAELQRVLDAFFRQKAERFAILGQPDVFAEPGVAAFIAEATHQGLEQGSPAIEMYYTAAGERIVATYGAAISPERFCGMFTSFDSAEDVFRWSPGDLMLHHLIGLMSARGLKVFDLGVGEAHYKGGYCDEYEPLFDTVMPLSVAGRALSLAYGAAAAAKHRIKASPRALSLVNRLRRGG